MKIKLTILLLAGILALSLVQFSCGSGKRSAVSCPDFSHSRNMKSRHVQLKNTYPDQQEKYQANSSRLHHPRFRSLAKDPLDKNTTSSLYPVPVYGIAGMHANLPGSYSSIQQARVQRASLVMPPERIQEPAIALEVTLQQGCDTIVLRNGDILEAKVLEIGEREIRYKKCGITQGPVLTISLSEVFMIKYPNGTRDYFTSERSPASPRGDTLPKKTHGMALSGFIGSLVGLFILGIPLGIMAIVFGFTSLGSIKRHPERYKGKGLAVAGIIIGIVDIIGMIIVLSAM